MATTALSLYQVEDTLCALVESAETVEPEQEQQFLADFGAALLSAKEKRDRVAFALAHFESQAALAKAEITRLQTRKASFERWHDRLEAYCISVIEGLGPDAKGKFRKLDGNTATLGLRGLPATVEILDEASVPLDYKRVGFVLPAKYVEGLLDRLELEDRAIVTEAQKTVTVEKKPIKEAIDRGEKVPGADLKIGGHALVVS